MTVVVIVLSVVVAVLAVLVAGLLRAYAEVLRQLHDLGAGRAAVTPFQTIEQIPGPPVMTVEGRDGWRAAVDLAGPALDGSVSSLRTVGVGNDTLIAFLSSGCAGCEGFWADLREGSALSLPPNTRLIVVTKDAAEESVSELRRLAAPGVDLVMSSEAWASYEVPGSPYVVVVDGPTGRVKGEGSGASFQQMSLLVRQAMGDAPGRLNRKPSSDAQRESDVDRQLLEARIGPGHPSLHGGAQG